MTGKVYTIICTDLGGLGAIVQMHSPGAEHHHLLPSNSQHYQVKQTWQKECPCTVENYITINLYIVQIKAILHNIA